MESKYMKIDLNTWCQYHQNDWYVYKVLNQPSYIDVNRESAEIDFKCYSCLYDGCMDDYDSVINDDNADTYIDNYINDNEWKLL